MPNRLQVLAKAMPMGPSGVAMWIQSQVWRLTNRLTAKGFTQDSLISG